MILRIYAIVYLIYYLNNEQKNCHECHNFLHFNTLWHSVIGVRLFASFLAPWFVSFQNVENKSEIHSYRFKCVFYTASEGYKNKTAYSCDSLTLTEQICNILWPEKWPDDGVLTRTAHLDLRETGQPDPDTVFLTLILAQFVLQLYC